jgi:phosphotriesterase-related protein
VEFIADVAEGSGMNIICSTGVYFESGPFAGLPTYYKSRRPEELEAIYRKEIEEGAGPRKIRPGVIKCATSSFEITEAEAKALSVAGRAARATDTRITTHTQEGTMGQEQLNLFEEEGVPPHHVTIGHCSDSKDMDYLAGIAKRGAYIGFDRVGIEAWVNDEIKLGMIAGLVAMGFERHIVLSHDNVGCSHAPRATRRPPDPKRRFTLIHEEFIPAMKRAGISERTIETMLVDNIRRFFEGDETP